MFNINAKKVKEKIEFSICLVCKKEKVSDVLIGVSGGVDSATSLTLAVHALGKQHVYPVLLPYGVLNDEGTKHAKLVTNLLKIPVNNVRVINIKPFVDSVVSYDLEMDKGRKGNIMARIRMVVLFDLSKKFNRLVVGTENKTEHLLGYYTRFGDEASDIKPIQELYKTEVYKLANHLKVPQEIFSKSPTAGLWEGQTDEGEFGFSYKLADEILYLYKEKHLSKDKILAKGYDKKIVDKVWWWIDKGEFKDRVPHTLK
ncbi:MAG: NAD+ synthase [bacterium]